MSDKQKNKKIKRVCPHCNQSYKKAEWQCDDGEGIDCGDQMSVLDDIYKKIVIVPFQHCHTTGEYDAVTEWCSWGKLDSSSPLFVELWKKCEGTNNENNDTARRCPFLFHMGDIEASSFSCMLYADGEVVLEFAMGVSGMGRDMMCLPDDFDELEESGIQRHNDYIQIEESEEDE